MGLHAEAPALGRAMETHLVIPVMKTRLGRVNCDAARAARAARRGRGRADVSRLLGDADERRGQPRARVRARGPLSERSSAGRRARGMAMARHDLNRYCSSILIANVFGGFVCVVDVATSREPGRAPLTTRFPFDAGDYIPPPSPHGQTMEMILINLVH
ncbi:hypothetical protein EVAR_64890_1 [Eumeta japonica]|uniref:Uncharacterized protein n=1 Tax=Eumeta variegata TaxID=151549 RepID=A0A4C1ZWI9_EUMVA|nr:hypothetical protein EVAR_64890_1 [Eumeta japonica]